MWIKEESSPNIKIKIKLLTKLFINKRNKLFITSSIIGSSLVFFFPFKNLSAIKLSILGQQTNAQELIYRTLPDKGFFEPIYNFFRYGNSLADLSYRFIKSNLKNPADKMQINIKLDNYQTLLEKRNQALKDGILMRSNNDQVNAVINFDNQTYKVRMRLKGDWVDHIKDDKWSFRVETKGDKSILGMKKFSLQHPRSRNYINEYIFHTLLKEEGIHL